MGKKRLSCRGNYRNINKKRAKRGLVFFWGCIVSFSRSEYLHRAHSHHCLLLLRVNFFLPTRHSRGTAGVPANPRALWEPLSPPRSPAGRRFWHDAGKKLMLWDKRLKRRQFVGLEAEAFFFYFQGWNDAGVWEMLVLQLVQKTSDLVLNRI